MRFDQRCEEELCALAKQHEKEYAFQLAKHEEGLSFGLGKEKMLHYNKYAF